MSPSWKTSIHLYYKRSDSDLLCVTLGLKLNTNYYYYYYYYDDDDDDDDDDGDDDDDDANYLTLFSPSLTLSKSESDLLGFFLKDSTKISSKSKKDSNFVTGSFSNTITPSSA